MQVRNQLRSRCPLHEPVASGPSRSRIPRTATALHDVRHEAGLVLHVAHDASGLLLRVEARGHQRLPDALSAWTERASHTGAQRRRCPISHRADQLVQHPLSEATEARVERRAAVEQALGPLVRCRHDVLRPRRKHRRRVRIATLRDHAAVQERKSGLERAVRPTEVKMRSRRVTRRADTTDQLARPYSLASLDQRLRRVSVDHLTGPALLEDRRSAVTTTRAHIRNAARERCHDRITVVVPTGTTVDVNTIVAGVRRSVTTRDRPHNLATPGVAIQASQETRTLLLKSRGRFLVDDVLALVDDARRLVLRTTTSEATTREADREPLHRVRVGEPGDLVERLDEPTVEHVGDDVTDRLGRGLANLAPRLPDALHTGTECLRHVATNDTTERVEPLRGAPRRTANLLVHRVRGLRQVPRHRRAPRLLSRAHRATDEVVQPLTRTSDSLARRGVEATQPLRHRLRERVAPRLVGRTDRPLHEALQPLVSVPQRLARGLVERVQAPGHHVRERLAPRLVQLAQVCDTQAAEVLAHLLGRLADSKLHVVRNGLPALRALDEALQQVVPVVPEREAAEAPRPLAEALESTRSVITGSVNVGRRRVRRAARVAQRTDEPIDRDRKSTR